MQANEWYTLANVIAQYSLLAIPFVIIVLAVSFARLVKFN